MSTLPPTTLPAAQAPRVSTPINVRHEGHTGSGGLSVAPPILPSDATSILRLGIVAGEASGDVIAAPVLRALLASEFSSATGANEGAQERGRPDQIGASGLPQVVVAGVAGPAMESAGAQAWWPAERLSVNGYSAVLRALPGLLTLRKGLQTRLSEWECRVFLGVDAPDFNLGLEARLRRTGVRTVHLVGPSVWAWRRERLLGIRRAVDHMLLLFPFEKPLYDAAGIRATYVGHPLADQIPQHIDRTAARVELGLDSGGPIVAVLPGSRAGEVEHMAPLFFDTIKLLARARPDWQFVMPGATSERSSQLRELLRRRAPGVAVHLCDGQSHTVMAAAHQILVASGTATLEAMLHGRPMVIAYRVAPLTARMMRHRGYLPYVGLPNILAGRFVVPEFLQEAATPHALARAVLTQADDDLGQQHLARIFSDLHGQLARGCAGTVAGILRTELADAAHASRHTSLAGRT